MTVMLFIFFLPQFDIPATGVPYIERRQRLLYLYPD
jgi:hypothetical protein